jgi:hypothetical protein
MNLTSMIKQAYALFQVLETPKQRKAAPVRSCGFFTSIVFVCLRCVSILVSGLWAGVRGIQYPKGELLRRLFAVSSSRPPARNGFLILQTEVQK